MGKSGLRDVGVVVVSIAYRIEHGFNVGSQLLTEEITFQLARESTKGNCADDANGVIERKIIHLHYLLLLSQLLH